VLPASGGREKTDAAVTEPDLKRQSGGRRGDDPDSTRLEIAVVLLGSFFFKGAVVRVFSRGHSDR